jgi:hypothetical protein
MHLRPPRVYIRMSLFILAAFSLLRLVKEVQRYAADFRQTNSDIATDRPCDGCAVSGDCVC